MAASFSGARRTALAGLVRRREIWLPTWRGWAALLLFLAAASAALLLATYPFLAVTAPRPHGALVVEGWAGPTLLECALEEMRNPAYNGHYVTGGPIETESPLVAYGTYAALGASRLEALGAPNMVPVPADWVKRDRTFSSALALRNWFGQHGGAPAELTILTQGPHARRTRLLFQRAFGTRVQVGVIAAPEREYDPQRWWTSSLGFRSVTGEAIAYLYARLLFWRSG